MATIEPLNLKLSASLQMDNTERIFFGKNRKVWFMAAQKTISRSGYLSDENLAKFA